MHLKQMNVFLLLLLITGFLLAASCAPAADAAEPTQPVVKQRGYIDHAALVATTKPTRSGVTTKGWVGNKHFKLKSTTRNGRTTTKGYVDGKYVRIKTRDNND